MAGTPAAGRGVGVCQNLLGVQQGVVPAGNRKPLQILMGFFLYIMSSFKLGFSLNFLYFSNFVNFLIFKLIFS